MKRDLLLPLSIFALAGAITLHAAKPAVASEAREVTCQMVDQRLRPDQREAAHEAVLNPLVAAGHTRFMGVGFTENRHMVCAW